MHRHTIDARPNWTSEVERLGLLYHTHQGKPYWFESAYYSFNSFEIDELEKTTAELMRLCLEAVDVVIAQNRFHEFAIPDHVIPAIKRAWDIDPPSIYGRFDLGWTGFGPPKLFEFNADTPTSLLEAAVVQWHWLQARFPNADQFNSIWEGLVAKWKALKAEGCLPGGIVYFAHADGVEDGMTIVCLRDTAQEAGLQTEQLLLEDIGLEQDRKLFVDLQGRPIPTLFKLYPWEWMVHDDFGTQALDPGCTTRWIEPVWKMILSNKALLALLWELNPHHPNLLPAYLDGPRDLDEYVKKPIFGREGANVTIVTRSGQTERSGEYGEEGFVYQKAYKLPDLGGGSAVIGSWVIDCEPRGIGIRESDGPITDDLSRFVPHLFHP